MSVATSTSGLFMKNAVASVTHPSSAPAFTATAKPARPPATGVGEDLMKGCTSYEIVRRMAQA